MSMVQATFQDIHSQCTLDHLLVTINGLSLFHPLSGQTLRAVMAGAPL